MEIKIDTKKDSPEEIQHMIDFLSRFISANEQYQASQSEPAQATPPVNEGMFGMFGSDSAPASDQSSTPEQSPDDNFTIQPY